MAIESVRAECQQMGVKEFFQIDVFWPFAQALNESLTNDTKFEKIFQPIQIEKIVDLVKRDFLIGGIKFDFNLKKFIDINVRDREI